MPKMLDSFTCRILTTKCIIIIIFKFTDHVRGCFQAHQASQNNQVIPNQLANHPLIKNSLKN